MHVVFVIIDSLPNRWVGEEWTPNLAAFAEDGGRCVEGGEAVLSTATYPNHATFVTGRLPESHGIFTNRVWDGDEFISSAKVGPAGDTLFLAARRSGVSTSVVVGDHKLIGVIGARDASSHWPPDGRRPDVALDEFRYAADSAVIDAIDELDALAADLTVVHFNEPDTACHLHGPDGAEALARFRSTDASLGLLIDRLRPQWDDTVVIVVSDHDQERVTSHGVDIQAALSDRGLPGEVDTEGTAALIVDGPGLDELRTLDGVLDGAVLDERRSLVWGPPGQVFGPWLDELHGSHGSPRCATQVAVVGGGHPQAARIGAALAGARPFATAWAPTIARLLGLDLRDVAGASLVPS